MKLSYLIPDITYSFFRQIIEPLVSYGIDLEVNRISSNSDLILVSIAPATPYWYKSIIDSDKPYILWHWDYYSFVDFNTPRWHQFIEMLPKAIDIWSCTYETARQLYEVFSLHSYIMPAWIDVEELLSTNSSDQLDTEPYAFYAASSCGFGKRLDWAEHACNLLKIPLKLYRGQSTPRQDYLNTLRGCSVYLMTAFEESNGTIPAMEAATLGKSIVLADITSSKEVFGNTDGVYYYNNWDFSSLLSKLREAWTNTLAYKSINHKLHTRLTTLNGLYMISNRIVKRIKELGYAIHSKP